MGEVAGFEPADNRDILRQQIQASLYNPISSLEYLGYFFAGEHRPPDNAVVLSDLTVEKVQTFYGLVRKELVDAEKDMRFSSWLLESLYPPPGEQTTFDHELAHVRSADSWGVDLHKSRLELFFLIDGYGLQLTQAFHPPEDIDSIVKLQIALAPEEPSSGDIAVVQKALRENQERLNHNPRLMREVGAFVFQQTGKSVDELTK